MRARLTKPVSRFQPLESAWVVLSKLAWANRATNVQDLIRAMSPNGVDLGDPYRFSLRYPDPALLEALALELDEPVDQTYLRFPAGFDYPGARLRYAARLRFCRRCLDQGFHCAITQLAWMRRCPLHPDELLLAECTECHRPIPYNQVCTGSVVPFTCPQGHQLWSSSSIAHWMQSLHVAVLDTRTLARYLDMRATIRSRPGETWNLYPTLAESPAEARSPVLAAPQWWHRQIYRSTFAEADIDEYPAHMTRTCSVNLELSEKAEPPVRSHQVASVERKVEATVNAEIRSAWFSLVADNRAAHETCLALPAALVREDITASRLPCRLVEALVILSWALGAPTLTFGPGSAKQSQLWPELPGGRSADSALATRLVFAGIEIEQTARHVVGAELEDPSICLVSDGFIRRLTQEVVKHAFAVIVRARREETTEASPTIPWEAFFPGNLVPFMHCTFVAAPPAGRGCLEVWGADDAVLRTAIEDRSSSHQESVAQYAERWLGERRRGHSWPKFPNPARSRAPRTSKANLRPFDASPHNVSSKR